MTWGLEYASNLASFIHMDEASPIFKHCIDNGVDYAELMSFINDPLKSRKREPFHLNSAPILLKLFLSMDGELAGGCVLDKIVGRKPKDFDVFFDSIESYALAFFASRTCPIIDVGFYRGTPWGTFDICASMCSLGKSGVIMDPRCEKAIISNISHVDLNNVIAPEATLKRILKYHDKYGFRFFESDIVFLIKMSCGESSTDEKLREFIGDKNLV